MILYKIDSVEKLSQVVKEYPVLRSYSHLASLRDINIKSFNGKVFIFTENHIEYYIDSFFISDDDNGNIDICTTGKKRTDGTIEPRLEVVVKFKEDEEPKGWQLNKVKKNK